MGPTISRKIRASRVCKKQKIRCDFEEGESTCVRCRKVKSKYLVNRILQTLLDEDAEYVIHHHRPSPIVDFPKDMKMGEGKKSKGWNTRKMEEEGRGDEGKEGKRSLNPGGNNEANSELIVGGSTLCAMIYTTHLQRAVEGLP